MRYLGVDYGKKTTGIAVSDETGAFAFPHGEFEANSIAETAARIIAIVRAEGAAHVVLGIPPEVEGISRAVRDDIEALFAALSEAGLAVSLENEMFSTRMAEANSEAKRHASAAAIILQSFLDKQNRLQ